MSLPLRRGQGCSAPSAKPAAATRLSNAVKNRTPANDQASHCLRRVILPAPHEQRNRSRLRSALILVMPCVRPAFPVRFSPLLRHTLHVATTVLSQEEALHWLALRMVPGLGTLGTLRLLEKLKSPQAIFRASASELEAAGITPAHARSIASGSSFEDAVEQQQTAINTGAQLITFHDPRYRSGSAKSSTRRFCSLPSANRSLWPHTPSRSSAPAAPRPTEWLPLNASAPISPMPD